MRYVLARVNMHIKAETYRFYFAESLKVISENTAQYASGTAMKSITDVFNYKPDNRTADEIKTGIMNKLKGAK